MAITLVQSNSSGLNSGSPTVLAFGSNNTGGNLLVVKVVAQLISTFGDSALNTYQNVTFASAVTGFIQTIYYCLSAKAGANTVTATGSFVMMTIAEYNAGAGFAFTALDGIAVSAQGVSATPSAGPIVTTNPNDLILGAGLSFGSPTVAGAGFTKVGQIGITGVEDGISERQIVTATGSYMVTFSAPNNNFSIIGVAIEATPTAPGPPATTAVFPLPVYKAIGIL